MLSIGRACCACIVQLNYINTVQEYVGTLRWGPDLNLPRLHRGVPGVLDSWRTFFDTRFDGSQLKKDGKLTIIPEMVDGM